MILKLPRLILNNSKWLEKQQTTILSAAAVITVANVFSSISGLIRERLLISNFFSTQASREAYEAFQVAFQIPDMMFQLIILGAVSAAFIPIYTHLKSKNKQQAHQMSSIVMNVLLLAFIGLSIVIAIFAHPLTVLRTGEGFTDAQIDITANLTRIMLIAQVFFAISNFLTGILQSYHRFIIPAIAPVLYNLGILLGVYFFSSSLGIYSAGLGVIIGAFLHMLIQLPLALRTGFRFRFSLNLSHPGIAPFFRLMPARVITLGISEIQNLSLGFFATTLGNLSFLVIRLALRLMTIPIRLFGVSIGQASLPFLSAESGDRNKERFSGLILQSINQIAFFSFPASVMLLILRVPLVRLVFGTKNFPWSVTLLTAKAVALIALSIGAQAMVQLLLRSFHALKDTKTPLLITAVTAVFYLVFSWIVVFSTDWGVLGIALVTSAAAMLELVLCLTLLSKKIPQLVSKAFWFPQIKMLSASFFMMVFLYLPYRMLDELIFDTSKTVELIALTITTGTIGILVYAYFAALFEIRELKLFTKIIRNFGPWRKSLEKSEEVLVETSVEGDKL